MDRARASGLIEPSHNPAFLRSVHRCIAQIIGTARHHEVETSLLYSQIELSTLSTDLALSMAEHGLRDDRLANALAELAARSQGQPAQAARFLSRRRRRRGDGAQRPPRRRAGADR